MLRVRLALVTGLAVMAAALGIVLSHAPVTVAGTNGVPVSFPVATSHGNEVVCHSGGTLPRGTSAIRVSYSADVGPEISLRAMAGSAVVTEGEREAGWGVDETVTVAVRRVARTTDDARICVTLGPAVEGVEVIGELVSRPSGAQVGWPRMEYLRPGRASWLSLLPSVVRDMGLARAPSGTWVAYGAIAVMIAVVALTARLLVRELG